MKQYYENTIININNRSLSVLIFKSKREVKTQKVGEPMIWGMKSQTSICVFVNWLAKKQNQPLISGKS